MFEEDASSALKQAEGIPIVGDFDGDGSPDFLMVPSPQSSVFLNDGHGNFTEVSESGIGSVSGGVVAVSRSSLYNTIACTLASITVTGVLSRPKISTVTAISISIPGLASGSQVTSMQQATD